MQNYYSRDMAVNRSAIYFCSVSDFFSFLHFPTNDSRTHARMISAHTHACASIICLSLRKSPISVCGSQPSVSATLIFQSLRWGLES